MCPLERLHSTTFPKSSNNASLTSWKSSRAASSCPDHLVLITHTEGLGYQIFLDLTKFVFLWCNPIISSSKVLGVSLLISFSCFLLLLFITGGSIHILHCVRGSEDNCLLGYIPPSVGPGIDLGSSGFTTRDFSLESHFAGILKMALKLSRAQSLYPLSSWNSWMNWPGAVL